MRLVQFVFFLMITSQLFSQELDAVDFTRIEVEITPIPETKEIKGNGTYTFDLNKKTDSIFIDAVQMSFKNVLLNNSTIAYSNTRKKLAFKAPKKLGTHTLKLSYSCTPKQTVYFVGFDDDIKSNEQIWTQGQGKYTSHWLPSFDDMTEKVEFDLSVTTDKGFKVISNGKLQNISKVSENTNTWKFDMTKPMSSYLAAFVIGDYVKKELQSDSGVPIALYYEPKDSLKVEPTYRYTKEIFNFLEDEIGVPYPWQNYKQVPVQDFLYAGMENTGTTIFSNTYVIDSTAFVDKNYVNVNAHELAHQWFGDLVTEKSANHHWLQEGFATYYAYLAEQQLFGKEHFYWKLYETAKTLKDNAIHGKGEALTNPKASSLTFYEKGAWALVMLKEQVGVEAFKKGVINYIEKYQYKNVTISDFLTEIEIASNQDLNAFRQKWLASVSFPWEEVKEKLKKESTSLALVFDVEDAFKINQSDDLDYEAYWDSTSSIYFKEYLIKEYSSVLPTRLIYKAFLSDNIKLRQALSNSLYGVSSAKLLDEELALAFETLLEDKSYITIENALIKLWSRFPEKRESYLTKTKDKIGLPNKNIRLLWLTLALVTSDYQPELKQQYYTMLNAYTAPHHHFEIRQFAFLYLNQINALSDTALLNLIKASSHHAWQFKKSSRTLLRRLSERSEMKDRLITISTSLNEKERNTLNQLITQ